MTVTACYWQAITDAICLRLGIVPRRLREDPRYPIVRRFA